MKEIDRRKQLVQISIFITSIFVIFLSITYAFISMTLQGTKKQVITAGNLSLELQEDTNNIQITDAFPMYDEVGMIQTPFTFRLVNNSSSSMDYVLKLVDITAGDKLSTSDVKYYLTKDGVGSPALLSTIVDGQVDSGKIAGNQTIEYSLRLWIDSSVTDDSVISGKSLSYRIDIEAVQSTEYKEVVLNGTDPVLTDDLVPVIIADDGVVTKADINAEWYNYENQQWANAVVLMDDSITYNDGETIPEENIESYFVWIPRYKYKIFNLGNYSSLTSVTNAVQTIEIEFENKDTTPTNGNSVGDWHSHPAFQTFDSNGFWVGKFESGYSGATSTTGAEVNISDSSKLIIKPNVYSWRSITVGNAFKTSYDYLREEDSHMMKNTEWGAVTYLQHSVYGSRESVRFNNNSSFITGYASISEPTCGYNTNGTSTSCNLNGTSSSVTLPYNTPTGYTASTTGNISGIYDMSGGTYEYVMGYTTAASTVGGESDLAAIYGDFFTNSSWEKYYDKYSVNSQTAFNNRILGDAIGEMGPFGNVADPDGASRPRGSWYGDLAYFIYSSRPWFCRGVSWAHGVEAGIFGFNHHTGNAYSGISFRVVLTP